MTFDLTPIVVPIIVSVVLSLSGAFVVARYSGPAQTAYIQALQGRLAVVEEERDDAQLMIPKLEARIAHLEDRVKELETAIHDKDRELASLYRRLDADERRIGHG